MSRYWLVKAPEGTVAETVCKLLKESDGGAPGVEVVEILPEKRGTNWMEVELAKQLTLNPGGKGADRV